MTEKATARAHPIQGLVKLPRDARPRTPTAVPRQHQPLYRPDRDDDHRRVAARRERGRIRHRRRGGRRTPRNASIWSSSTSANWPASTPRSGWKARTPSRRTSASARRRPGSRPPRSRSPRPLASTSLYRISPPSPVAAPPPRPVSVTGAYSRLDAGLNDEDCRSHRLDVGVGDDGFDPEEDLRIVAAHVPAYKETEEAHREPPPRATT